MLEHGLSKPTDPDAVVVMGAAGFVGGTISKALHAARISVDPIASSDIDLLDPEAVDHLSARIPAGAAFVMVSAIAPCRDGKGLVKNVTMANHACQALAKSQVSHIVYISSDAVYAEDANPVTERSPAAPISLHGAMHLARETLFRSAMGETPLAILRPSLLYGASDPHNGYGPNRFFRSAKSEGCIALFGEGEERRDHVAVEDLAAVVLLCLRHRSRGVLNVATGTSPSFREVAELVAAGTDGDIKITGSPRANLVTHRHFDVTEALHAFPAFRPTVLADGLTRVRMAEAG